MTDTNAAIAVYDTHSEAENAVKELQKSGFDMKKLSVVGKDFHRDEQVVGYYNAGDRMKYWGKMATDGTQAGRSFLSLSVTPQGQAAVLYIAAVQ